MPLENRIRLHFSLLAGLVCLIGSSSLNAATNSDWFARVWQSDEGLPDNIVVGVAQTPDGFLWVATQNGLVRFDGVRFREVGAANAPGLNVGDNYGLALDHAGRLWLVKKRGCAICLGGQRNLTFTSEDGLSDRPVTDLAIDQKDGLWLSASGLGNRVVRIQDGIVRPFSSEEGLPLYGGCWLASDRNGELWLATKSSAGIVREGKFVPLIELSGAELRIAAARSGGIWLLSGSQLLKYAGGSAAEKHGELPNYQPPVRASVLYEDRAGRVWIGTRESGLFLYEGSGFSRINTSHPKILCLAEDHESNIWVGTEGGGLNRLRPRRLELHNVEKSVPAEMVLSACVDRQGDAWAVAETLARRQGGVWTTVASNMSLNIPNFVCVAADPQGGVWVGTQYGGLLRWQDGVVRTIAKTNGLASQFVRSLLVTAAGEVWAGTDIPIALQRVRGEQIRTFDLPPLNNPVITMAEDGLGNLWAGTAEGFLLRVNHDMLVDETANTLRERRPIHALCTTPDNSLWIGYAGGGLGRLRAGRFSRFTTDQGLPENQIVQMNADGHGWLWFAGAQGLFRARLEDFDAVEAGRIARVRPVVFGPEEGMPPLQASRSFWPNAFRSADGHMWFSTLAGLLEVEAEQTGGNMPPPTVIEQVTVDGRKLTIHPHKEQREHAPDVSSWLESRDGEIQLRLPANNRRTGVEFTALSFAAPRNVAFRYMLEGLDQDWVDAGRSREAQFSHLAPGRYRFRVIACNNEGIWNETGAGLGIIVLAPFWKTAWFIALVGLTAAGSIGGAARYFSVRRMRRQLDRLEREHAVERERARIAKDMHDTLGASLSEITLLSELAQGADSPREEVETDLRRIASKARDLTRSLAEIVWAVNPQHDAFDSFVTYTCNFAEDYLRLAEIRCRLDIPANLPHSPLTTQVRHNLFLIVKEAIHNIVKHAAASEVWIRIAMKQDGFRLLIEDDGKGFDLESRATGGDGGNETGLRARLESPADARGAAFGVPPSGDFGTLPPEGGTPNQLAKHALRPGRQGHGLLNMRQRAEDVGGRLELRSQPGRGTTVQLDLEFSKL